MAGQIQVAGQPMTKKQMKNVHAAYRKRYTPNVLNLVVHRKWFQMILNGDKKEEYRERKHYWFQRLLKKGLLLDHWPWELENALKTVGTSKRIIREFDVVRFTNGYRKNSPSVDVEFLGIKVGVGKKMWGCGRKKVFIIKIGKIISSKNC